MSAPLLTLKVDVDTYRGTREGVPRLMRALDAARARATFLFSLGPDHTGRAIRRVFRPGFFAKIQRTSVVEHYGVRTLLYGTLLPGPDIGRRCAAELRACGAAGHQTGIHTWDHIAWQDNVRRRGADWTAKQMRRAFDRYGEVFGSPPPTHGAAGWQMNEHALREELLWGLRYASDGRGVSPFRPLLDGKAIACVQLPTTLPTMDELIGIDGVTGENVDVALLALTARAPRDHTYTLHAELEGGRLLPAFERLLAGWRSQGYALGTMADAYARLDAAGVPAGRLSWGAIPGRSGELMVQEPR